MLHSSKFGFLIGSKNNFNIDSLFNYICDGQRFIFQLVDKYLYRGKSANKGSICLRLESHRLETKQWLQELNRMTVHIIGMRTRLKYEHTKQGHLQSWDLLTDQFLLHWIHWMKVEELMQKKRQHLLNWRWENQHRLHSFINCRIHGESHSRNNKIMIITTLCT